MTGANLPLLLFSGGAPSQHGQLGSGVLHRIFETLFAPQVHLLYFMLPIDSL